MLLLRIIDDVIIAGVDLDGDLRGLIVGSILLVDGFVDVGVSSGGSSCVSNNTGGIGSIDDIFDTDMLASESMGSRSTWWDILGCASGGMGCMFGFAWLPPGMMYRRCWYGRGELVTITLICLFEYIQLWVCQRWYYCACVHVSAVMVSLSQYIECVFADQFYRRPKCLTSKIHTSVE